MAPTLSHPPGVSFIDEKNGPVNSDAASYYGGGEFFSRARTYSYVSTYFNHRKWYLSGSVHDPGVVLSYERIILPIVAPGSSYSTPNLSFSFSDVFRISLVSSSWL